MNNEVKSEIKRTWNNWRSKKEIECKYCRYVRQIRNLKKNGDIRVNEDTVTNLPTDVEVLEKIVI